MEDPKPDPGTVSPLVFSDPFWGEPPYTYAYIVLGAFVFAVFAGLALVVLIARG